MQPPYVPRIRRYRQWLQERHGLSFDSYEALRLWSVTEYDAFWRSVWDFDGMTSPTPFSAVLPDERMPGARWFPGAQVNFAQRVLRHVGAADAAGRPAASAARGSCRGPSCAARSRPSRSPCASSASSAATASRPGCRTCRRR